MITWPTRTYVRYTGADVAERERSHRGEPETAGAAGSGAASRRPRHGRPPSRSFASWRGGAAAVRGPAHTREVPFGGGHLTRGVVRAGDTVRRPRASAFVERLLRHLEAVGFDGAPRWLGVDDEGRDVLGYLPGRVAEVDQRLSGAQVAAAGRLLRAFHDATRGSALAGEHETVCHHDAGPHNMVFGEDGLPYALIDFDVAAPGDALDDVSYAAWLCCLNSAWVHSARPDAQARCLRRFVDSYGLDEARRAEVLDAVIARQFEGVAWARRCLADLDQHRNVREHARRMLTGCTRERAFVLRNRAAFEHALR